MANTKVSALTSTTAPDSTDIVYVVDSGNSRQVTLSNLSKGIVLLNTDITGLTASELLRINSGGTAIESSGLTPSGSDVTLISGTAGTNGDLAQWNADGDLVDGPTPPSGDIAGTTDTQTFTNKRVTPRVSTETSSATPTINTDNVDAHSITALAANITSFTTNLSGTPTNFQKLTIRILDDGSNRTIAWGASFASKGATLPTTTTANKLLTVGLNYNTVTSKWECVAAVEEV